MFSPALASYKVRLETPGILFRQTERNGTRFAQGTYIPDATDIPIATSLPFKHIRWPSEYEYDSVPA